MKFNLLTLSFCLIANLTFAQSFSEKEIAKLQKQAQGITIIKDKYGVPHVYTETDADAVFGMMYVQCEEFFEKVERHLINQLGRQAEVDGEKEIYGDLWARMFIDSTKAVKYYKQSPKWLRKLCDGYANGINFYMISHPEVKPKLITRVQPWMVLMNNIPSMANCNITEAEFRAFYGRFENKVSLSLSPDRLRKLFDEFSPSPDRRGGWGERLDGMSTSPPTPLLLGEGSFSMDFPSLLAGEGAGGGSPMRRGEPTGSNGWAIAPWRTQNKKAMLLINPHSEFYGRIEIQLVSKEGLNVYGAPFLGQFNVFQGFNENLGWMHPITMSDNKDLYETTVRKQNGGYAYRYKTFMRGIDSTKITLRFKEGNALKAKTFTVFRTHHGPVVARRNQKWVSLKTLDANIDLLAVNWQKTKAKNLEEFKAQIGKRVMTGNNIIYADKVGNIAYWHGNFVPKRDTNFDWRQTVNGSTDSTEWQGTHTLDELPQYFNPASGFVQNCNSTPLYGAGQYDAEMAKKPHYMLPDGHTPRAMSAVKLLANLKNATIDDVVKAAHDSYLANGEKFIPTLIKSYESLPQNDTLTRAVQVLKDWNYRADTNSVATTLAVLWLEKIIQRNLADLPKPIASEDSYAITNGSNISLKNITEKEQVEFFKLVIKELEKDFGTWEVAWGTINRFQRNADGQNFSDTRPSWAVTATPGFMGSINAYVSRKQPQTKQRYGISGNTFVAVVEFGDKIRAKTILSGGASSDTKSPHFTDQVSGYINADFKEIFFYEQDVKQNAEKTYKPGQK